MKTKSILMCLALAACGAVNVQAQQAPAPVQDATEQRVATTEPAIALDARGRESLAARLRTTTLSGTPDAPVQNVRLVVENRSQYFYTYVSGWVTFYDTAGVRCGEGLFKLDALAAGESAETDTPGLSLRCTPATWRVVATNLLTRTSDTAKPNEPPPAEPPATPASGTQPTSPNTTTPAAGAVPPLMININGRMLPVQLNNPINIRVGRERLRITVSAAP